MKGRNNSIGASLIFALLLGSFSLPLFAQQVKMLRVGKKGEVAFASPVRVGNVLLKPGDYQIQHVTEGETHVIVFKRMVRPGGYGELRPGKEVARVPCRLEPLGEKAKYTTLRFGVNAAGEKTLEEVRVRGENVKHVF